MAARPDPALHRHSARFFVIFLALTVWAFWPSYFSRLFEQPNVWFHAHGIVLSLWLVLLVVQAQLIRTGRRPWHRRLGKLAYLLAPAVVIVTTVFIHQRIGGRLPAMPQLPPGALVSLALMLLSLVAFGVCVGCALWFRHAPEIHARWMVASVFPLVTPVSDRLIGAHLPSWIGALPQVGGGPLLPIVGFAAADLALLALAWWDWRVNGRRDVFLVALGVVLLYHLGTLTLYRVPLWNAVCVWFLGLPLS
jgi:hypothetical protein